MRKEDVYFFIAVSLMVYTAYDSAKIKLILADTLVLFVLSVTIYSVLSFFGTCNKRQVNKKMLPEEVAEIPTRSPRIDHMKNDKVPVVIDEEEKEEECSDDPSGNADSLAEHSEFFASMEKAMKDEPLYTHLNNMDKKLTNGLRCLKRLKDKHCVLLVGPTGAGKSTIANALLQGTNMLRLNDKDAYEAKR